MKNRLSRSTRAQHVTENKDLFENAVAKSFSEVSDFEMFMSQVIPSNDFWEVTIRFRHRKPNHVYKTREIRYFYVGRSGGFYIVTRNNMYRSTPDISDILAKGKRASNSETKEPTKKKKERVRYVSDYHIRKKY